MFKKGQSGNLKGRPPGGGKVAEYRKLLQSRSDELIKVLVDQALAGEPSALKMCIDRLLPPYRSEAMPVTFPMPEPASLTKMGEAILSAISNGDLSPDQGTAFLHALVGQAKLVEVTELEKRIAALEFEVNHGR